MGGNHSNGTIAGRRYCRPRDRHPARGPGVVHVEASAWICAGVRLRTMTRQEKEEGGGGEYNRECLFDNDRDNNEYDNEDKYNDGEDGKGSRGGADNEGEPDYDGRNIVRGPSFGGMGHRMPIVGPHATVAIIDNNDNGDYCIAVGGGHAPPLRSIPSRRPPLVIVDVANRGQWRRHEGIRGGVVHVVEEEGPHRCTHLSGSDPTWDGQWGEEERRDVGWIMRQITSGWGRRRRRPHEGNGNDDNGYRGRGERGGDGGGAWRGGGGRRGRGLFSGPRHDN
jgi:hypothetical protein